MEEIKLKQVGQLEGNYDMQGRVYDPDGLCPAIRTMQGGGLEPKIVAIWDGFNQSVRKDSSVCGTLTSNCGADLKRNGQGIIVREATKQGYSIANYGDSVNLKYPNSQTRRGRVGKDCANTITCEDGNPVVDSQIRIRKLTPKECWRLMGFDDDSFDRAKKVVSNSQLYKQAGNSIVVDVLMAIFRELF